MARTEPNRAIEALGRAGRPTAILGLAATYYVVGRLALLLAIPPGYAAAVWPAAGIALAGVLLLRDRVWPGIVLGSFLVNAWTSFDSTDSASILKSLVLAIAIGVGAALQAVAGASLVRRFVGFPHPLDEPGAIVRFLGLGGPVSCLVSATFGVTALALSRVIQWSDYSVNWSTWWVGDTFGVVTVTPLVLIWTAEPHPVWRRRRLTVALPLCLVLSMVTAFFVYARASEQGTIAREFQRRAAALANAVRRTLDSHLDALHSVESLYASSSRKMDRHEFHVFVQHLLARHHGMSAVSWDARITNAERAASEEAARRDGYPDFQITEHDRDGRVVRAAERSEYVVVYHIEPYPGNESTPGFDVASDPARVEALTRARHTGEPTATGRLLLGREPGREFGFLVFLPVYRQGRALARLEARAESLDGFVTGVFRVGDVVEASLEGVDREGIAFQLSDETGPPDERVLYVDRGNARAPQAGPTEIGGRFGRPLGLHWVTTLEVGGRQWMLRFTPTAAYLVAQRFWQAWTVVASGLLVSAMLGAFLLVVSGRAVKIEQLVTRLSQTNADLEREITERKRTEEALAQHARELARSNADLEQFAHVASHDLQEPLRMVASYTQLLARRYRGRLDADADQFIAYAVEGASRMHAMIRDLLAYSRVGTAGREFESVSCEESLERALANLRAAIEERGAVVSHGPLPTVQADGAQLVQLFQNLIGNGLKFCGRSVPRVHVSAKRQPEGWLFSVRDNGIGIDPQYAERIFVIFQRLHVRGEYPGTGIGLAICKKIVERHGGRIWVESQPGRGATFRLTIPVRGEDS